MVNQMIPINIGTSFDTGSIYIRTDNTKRFHRKANETVGTIYQEAIVHTIRGGSITYIIDDNSYGY